MIGKKLLHYRLSEKLGAGGMGMVYKAEDTKLDRTVAIKLLPKYVATHPEELERFKIEAKSAAALNHPNIATIHAIEEEDLPDNHKLIFIVMEYIEGTELLEKLNLNPPTLEESLSIAIQIASGLQTAHQKGIIHRDIKSSNVMVSSNGHVKIMDFGLAKISDGKLLTKAGTLLGTASYMSPEQAKEEIVDHRSDIWSFGILFYEMLCGKLPFNGAYEHSIIYSILNDEFEPIRSINENIPPEYEEIINKALTKEINNRYQSFDEILVDLQKLANISSSFFSSSNNLLNQSFIQNRSKSILKNSPSNLVNKSIGERRNITTLVCNFELVSQSNEDIDPEDSDEFLPYCVEISEKVIDRFDGFIYNLTLTELTIIFGYPIAFEDGAKRATFTALGILEGVLAYSDKIKISNNIAVSVKLSIDTGTVLVKSSTLNNNNIEIVGESLKTTSRLQSVNEGNSILATNETFNLIAGYFEIKEKGEFDLSGSDSTIKLYEVLNESQARGRLEASVVSGLTPLTGRKKEFDLLTNLWENTIEGIGQVIAVQGEAGIGKSRLVQALKEHVALNPQAWLIESFCSPFYQSSTLQPIIELFERNILDFRNNITDEQKLKKVEGFLVQYGFPLNDSVPLLCSLLSIPLGDKYSPLSITPEAQKRKINETLINLLIKRAETQPVLFIVDDLQWADPTTIDLLGLVIEHIQTSRVLLLFTYRPTFSEKWENHTHMTKISLNRLPYKEINEFILKLTKGKSFPPEVVIDIRNKTDGVPLFVEELTKMILNSDYLIEEDNRYILKNELKDLQIPATLKDSLMARLDKMGTAKEVAQLCATIGRELTFDLVKEVSGLDDKRLKDDLDKLVKAEILYRKGLVGQERYIFKHALIQDTAYQSLLKRRRQAIHENIANVLKDKFSYLGETQPELFAYHYTSAGIYNEAITFWHKAGLLSFQRSANVEATTQLKKGLALIDNLTDDLQKRQFELMFLSILGPATIALKGFGAEEVGTIFSRSNELCNSIGETPLLFPSIWGQWVYNLVRANFDEAQKLSGEMLTLGKKFDESSILIEGLWTRGDNLFWLGDLNNSKEHLEKAIKIYDPEKHHMNAYYFGQDPNVAAHCYLSYANWFLGYPDLALKNTEDALKIAKQLNHPFSIGWALAFKMMILGFLREPELSLKAANETIEYCTEQAYPFWISSAQIICGWAMCELGDTEDGLKMMKNGINMFSFIGSIVVYPLFMGILAETQCKMNLNPEALKTINEAIELAVTNKELASEADLYRIKGNILQSISNKNITEIEENYQLSIKKSKEMGARSRELQASIDLYKFQQKYDLKNDGKKLLSDICSGFTEGLETKDYLEAKKLLL